MAKPPRLTHVKFVRAPDCIYAYFNTGQKVNGKPVYVPLPHWDAPDFFAKYGALMAGRTKRQATDYTIARFVDDYLDSPAYTERADATRKLYRFQLDKLTALVGKHAVSRIEVHHIRKIVDDASWGAGTKNAFMSTIGALYAWGRRTNKTKLRPNEDFEKFEMGEHEPWPEWLVEAALQSDIDRVRLGVHVLYFTGLRIGDACRFGWTMLDSGVLTITPSKTRRYRKTLYITVAGELQAELDRTPKRGLTVMAEADGRPLRVATLRDELQAFTRALGVETVPHGLRKNAVMALLDAGCTTAEVQAITGQSLQMIEHYAAKLNTRKAGKSAIVKFDARRRGNA